MDAQERTSQIDISKGTLKSGEKHTWTKHQYTKLSFKWAGPAGVGACSVKLGDAAATSYSVPRADLQVGGHAGTLTNNTDRTISYELA